MRELAIGKLGNENWEHVIPFFAFSGGWFVPSDEAALKLLYLELRNVIGKLGAAAASEGSLEPVRDPVGRSKSSAAGALEVFGCFAGVECRNFTGRLRRP